MLSILPPRDTDSPSIDVLQIVLINHPELEAMRHERDLQPLALPAPRLPTRRAIFMAAGACCLAAGVGAAVFARPVPSPTPPVFHTATSSLAMPKPVRVEPLPMAERVVGTGAYSGWVANSDLGDRDVKVTMLPIGGALTTLAIEMTEEPRMAMMRAVSARAFDIEITPVAGFVRAQELVPALEAGFIRQVSVQGRTVPGRHVVRARVRLDVPGSGNVRVVGRTVYADFIARPTS